MATTPTGRTPAPYYPAFHQLPSHGGKSWALKIWQEARMNELARAFGQAEIKAACTALITSYHNS